MCLFLPPSLLVVTDPKTHRIIAFRYIPNSVVTRPVEAIWQPAVSKPFFRLPYRTRLALGWLCLLGIVFGSAFGFPLQEVSLISEIFLNPALHLITPP
jgi:hypothetical protein